MFSRPSPRGATFEVSRDSVDIASIPSPLPPPPPRNPSNGPDPRHVRRPPTLNTSFPYQPGATHLASAVTPSTLSSPFAFSAVAHAASAGAVPGPASRGVSPDNHRLSGNFTNMTYNPQEWASGRQSVESRNRTETYGEPLHTPPPPYPELRSNPTIAYSRPGAFPSPNVSLDTSPVLQHATIIAEPFSYTRPSRVSGTPSNSRQVYESRRATRLANNSGPEYVPAAAYHQYSSQQANPNNPSSLSFQISNVSNAEASPLPPPPRRSPPNVSISDADSAVPLSYTRRATSAGPTVTAGPSASRIARSFSGGLYNDQSDWNPAVPLPGPPPGPPPPSSRSRSAGGDSDSDRSGLRQRPPRLIIKSSNLETIPATPRSIQSGVTPHSAIFPLRIDTGGASGHGKTPATVPVGLQDEDQASIVGPSALARRSAVRGPATRSSSTNYPDRVGIRSQSASGRPEPNEQPPSSTLSTNPWATALEQIRSPRGEGLTKPLDLPVSDSLHRVAGDVQSQTPPVTPGFAPHKTVVEQNQPYQQAQQAKVLPTPPLSQKPLLSGNSITTATGPQNELEREQDEFVTQAIQRHAEFLRKEQEAHTDLDRLALFTSFIQQESLIRKERYITAFKSDDFDLEAAKTMLFNASKVRRASEREDNIDAAIEQSPVAAGTASLARNDSSWWKDYRPALSPIASMGYDEQSSRGRPASRWWESATGSQSDGAGQGVHRTKRESKYMSLSTKLLHSMENDMEPLQEDKSWSREYPDEKANPETFGFYEEEVASPPLTARYQQRPQKPSMLDISRFVTLPPPYPRHFPAVNNNHPDLAEYRATVRTLSDLNDVQSRRSRHNSSVEAMRVERNNRIAESRKNFRASIQSQIADGSMSYAEAAEAEKLMKVEENEMEKQGLQAEFDTLQDVVINPLHEQLNERIERLSSNLESLQKELFASAAHQDPDQPVQEGDDVPELLEQLTQLKWLFEARETMYQEVFKLLSQRNDAYRAIVALPYQQSKNLDKIRDTDAFFDKDAATRHASFCAEALTRHESFLRFIEDNAMRGIEMQSSAFWDITPGLVDLIQKVPTDLNKLEIHVPEQELQENPSYHEHPQQYLYLLLRHAERSSYQYVEGQINLYCLLHEVKTSSLLAHYRASEAHQKMAGDQSIDLAETRLEDEGELTDELKNRATMIEEQWQDALGKQFDAIKGRVRKELEKRGAWDDIAAETEG